MEPWHLPIGKRDQGASHAERPFRRQGARLVLLGLQANGPPKLVQVQRAAGGSVDRDKGLAVADLRCRVGAIASRLELRKARRESSCAASLLAGDLAKKHASCDAAGSLGGVADARDDRLDRAHGSQCMQAAADLRMRDGWRRLQRSGQADVERGVAIRDPKRRRTALRIWP
eukprot:1959587-Prymnesium_polylepis.1